MTIEEHYQRIAPKLTNWLVATGSHYAEACDLVQNTFLKLWKMREDLQDSDSAVSGLAFTIARNLRKNFWRDNQHLDFVEEVKEEDGGLTRDLSEAADVAMLRERLQAAFSALPPTLRDAYTMFQIGGLSIREIAHETGISESLVKVRIFRAKEKLKTLLADLRL
ncbi:MAG: RNA polymerase sigma factor [Victivallales bacterium]|nr:RNA polymerase sigma factor [Victivallales bacterium]